MVEVRLNDLSDTLLIFPCSKSKKGTDVGQLHPVTIEALVGDQARRALNEGRSQAWGRREVMLDKTSPLLPALGYYTGRLYEAPTARRGILRAIDRGAHCIIISGGYGVLRAEEPIHNHEAHLPKTMNVWKQRVPMILRDYVERQSIQRTYGCFSRAYGSIVPENLTNTDWRHVPEGSGTGQVLNEIAATWSALLNSDLTVSRVRA